MKGKGRNVIGDEALCNDIAVLERTIAPLERLESELKLRLASLRRPSGMAEALGVSAVFAILGIVIPVLMLPVSSDSFGYFDKWVAVGAFLAGLILFFGYLLRLARGF